jgi:NADH:ubiquinone oxidoreductase subunit 6 (subunit J)
MSMQAILFYLFAIGAIFSGVGILITRNILRGVLMLLVALLCIAGIYVLAFAEFVAVVQLLIYAGGVLVVIIFGIMLTAKISGKPLIVKNSKWGAGLITAFSFLFFLIYFFYQEKFRDSTAVANDGGYTPINQVGIKLMSDFVLPFEVAGILLLISLIGAAVVASYDKKESNGTR